MNAQRERRITAALQDATDTEVVTIGAGALASVGGAFRQTYIEKLIAALPGHDAVPVAVGSETLNDIVKRASYECDRRCLGVGTAASMDGYTTFGAAITKEGYKQTMTCPAPRALVGDLNVRRRAPAAMTASGYADLLAKVTAEADRLVADALEVEKA